MSTRVIGAKALGPTVSRKYSAFHAHGCLQCGRRYADSCETPKENAVCMSCRAGQPVPSWDLARYPQLCCEASSRMVTDVVVLNRYGLAGPGPWYFCHACGRTHPFKPGGATARNLIKETPS